MANQSEDSLVEKRAELMKGSPLNARLNFRVAHFLNPSTPNSTDGAAPDFPPNSSSLANIDVAFNGWKQPQRKWITWFENLQPLYQPIWERAGIHQALRNSIYCIQQNKDLILGFAERWCSRTQSFVFPWGECSITLEDVMILGSYSVVGNSVFATPETREERARAQGLEEVRKELAASSARKATQSAWMIYFMDSGSAIEHEAFLAIWLSRLVFPSTQNSVVKSVLPLAVRLARGEKIAFAPAVLAKIYNDLNFLKANITERNGERVLVTIWASFHLVQVWVWERFQTLRPVPNFIQNGEPRLARWHDKNKSIENVRSEIDSAQQRFYWRPYVAVDNNPLSRVFYKDNEEKISNVGDEELNEELELYIRCLRVSELVGLEEECIEQYLPHRVAMQFGLDQDIPTHVPRGNIADRETVWRNYTRRIRDAQVYFPSRANSGVSDRYNQWWSGIIPRGQRSS